MVDVTPIGATARHLLLEQLGPLAFDDDPLLELGHVCVLLLEHVCLLSLGPWWMRGASFMPKESSVQLLVLMWTINLVDMPESMLLTHLESFIEVARTGNVSRAAQTLFLTQPAVTARLKSLESDLGIE